MSVLVARKLFGKPECEGGIRSCFEIGDKKLIGISDKEVIEQQ